MSVRVWVLLGFLAFVGGSLLRLGVETGTAGFTMFGMIAFVLIGLLALQEVAGLQTRAGWGRLGRVLRAQAAARPVLRLPGGGRGSLRYLVAAGSTWVALGVDTSSEAGLWSLVRPALAARGRRVIEEASRLPLGDQAPAVMPALVLLRRKVRAREEALGEGLGVRLLNPEELPGFFQEVAARKSEPGETGDESEGVGEAPPSAESLARLLGAEILAAGGGRQPAVEAPGVRTYPVR